MIVNSFFDIVAAMRSRQIVTLKGPSAQATGLVNGIAPEDGSGRAWLVTIMPVAPVSNHCIWAEPAKSTAPVVIFWRDPHCQA